MESSTGKPEVEKTLDEVEELYQLERPLVGLKSTCITSLFRKKLNFELRCFDLPLDGKSHITMINQRMLGSIFMHLDAHSILKVFIAYQGSSQYVERESFWHALSDRDFLKKIRPMTQSWKNHYATCYKEELLRLRSLRQRIMAFSHR